MRLVNSGSRAEGTANPRPDTFSTNTKAPELISGALFVFYDDHVGHSHGSSRHRIERLISLQQPFPTCGFCDKTVSRLGTVALTDERSVELPAGSTQNDFAERTLVAYED